MNVTTSRWQVPLLMILMFGLTGILWWRLQPPPPVPMPSAPILPERATPNHPLKSGVLPGLQFEYPASRERNNLDFFEYYDSCAGPKEVFFWEYKKALALAGAPEEIINFKLKYFPFDQSSQQGLLKQQFFFLDKFFSKVLRDFYLQINRGGKTVLGTGTEPLPNGAPGDRKTFGRNDTLASIAYNGKYYGSFIKSYSSPNQPDLDLLVITLCQLSKRPN
jgi:hypothetical protein